MQYPVCTKLQKYEQVAIAQEYPTGRGGYRVVWRFNDGHYGESMDKLSPTNIGDILAQPYGEDTGRFIIPVRYVGEYTFEFPNTFPDPTIMYEYDYIHSDQTIRMLVYHPDTSAKLYLSCNNAAVNITDEGNRVFAVKASSSLINTVVQLTATSSLAMGTIINSSTRNFFITTSIPEAPTLDIPSTGVVGVPMYISVPDNNTYLLTTNGKLSRSGLVYSLLVHDEGISKVVAFRIMNGLTSNLLEANISFFLGETNDITS